MLNQSNDSLFTSIKTFVRNSSRVRLYSAYIKSEIIDKINVINNIDFIVVRWEIADLVNGISDLELYNYCKINRIKLFRNTRIHLKAIVNDNNQIIFGSSNYTNNGMALSENHNFELNSNIENLDSGDLLYLNKILKESEYIDENKFLQIKSEVDKYQNLRFEIKEMPTLKNNIDNFLISQLPMSKNFELLYDYYNNSKYETIEDQNCFIHDLVLFDIVAPGLSYDDFIFKLKSTFNNHEFILKLKEFIRSEPNQSLRYGGVVDWIKHNTTTVPTPLSWELKEQEIVNILYYWITSFDSDFTTAVPGRRSEVISYKKS
jgi:phosphatidylserine/phosphatidylglycerophosphate/cardiolipin synthase-like enzyme